MPAASLVSCLELEPLGEWHWDAAPHLVTCLVPVPHVLSTWRVWISGLRTTEEKNSSNFPHPGHQNGKITYLSFKARFQQGTENPVLFAPAPSIFVEI